MHELTKLTEEWLSRMEYMFKNDMPNRHVLEKWESEVLLPYMREYDAEMEKKRIPSFIENYLNNIKGDIWDIEKRREKALWLKGKKFGRVAGYIKDEEIDQAFGIEEKSLEIPSRDEIMINLIKAAQKEHYTYTNYGNMADYVFELIQTIKSHYGIEEDK